jgi:hypothetical protein
MLTNEEFNQWCHRLNLSEQARKLVEQIRLSPPSRRVGGGKKNVSGRYPSRKMGGTIQFESHRNELAHIYKLEIDDDVLEYYDQPPPIFLDYLSKSGRRNRHQHTPDFFVIRKNTAGWEECKTEEHLLKLEQDSPNRWCREDNGQWYCPPGEEYASPFGFYYIVRSSGEINLTFVRNFIWLEDYFSSKRLIVKEKKKYDVKEIVNSRPGITLTNLILEIQGLAIDDLNILIATNEIYVDIYNDFLGEPEGVTAFLDEESAFIHTQTLKVAHAITERNSCSIKVTIGTSVCWDENIWTITNAGEKTIALLKDDGALIELPNHVFEDLIKKEKITGLLTAEEYIHPEIEYLLNKASTEDRKQATDRYKIIEAFLNGTSHTKPNRTQRRWIQSYRKAEKIYGNGFVGLFSRHQDKGWRREGLPEEVRLLMEEHIKEYYEKYTQPSIRHAYGAFEKLCEKTGYKPPSRESYRQAVRNRPLHEQIEKRMGERAAYKEEPFYWYLDLETTPPHGDRPFEIGHIDHTEVDLALLSSVMLSLGVETSLVKENQKSGKAWATLLTDANSRRNLATYMTFDPPSYRSCMMVLRICVQRYKRLPQIIVVDWGPDFRSTDFETLIAYYRKTKKERPPTKARYGTVIENLFGVADKEFWHQLQGNTKIMKNVRQVTKGVNPKNHAVWTLSTIYTYFCEYCYEIYDTSPHPTLRMSPREAFNIGIARGGLREHTFIQEQEFNLMALPSITENNGERKVTQEGVKINYLYYWHPSFTLIRNSKVKVKYDPFDITVAYAYVKGEWLKCRSRYLRELEGHSEKELMIATAELKKLNSLQNQQFNEITGKKLAEFFKRIEMEEEVLTPALRAAKKAVVAQRIKDGELKLVHAQIGKELIEPDSDSLASNEIDDFESNHQTAESYVSEIDDSDKQPSYKSLEIW